MKACRSWFRALTIVSTGRLSDIPSDQKREHVVADILVTETLFCDRIAAVQHLLQQVISFPVGSGFLSLCNNAVRNRVHQFDILFKFCVGMTIERLQNAKTLCSLSRLLEAVNLCVSVQTSQRRQYHSLNKRMHVFAIKVIESVIKRA